MGKRRRSEEDEPAPVPPLSGAPAAAAELLEAEDVTLILFRAPAPFDWSVLDGARLSSADLAAASRGAAGARIAVSGGAAAAALHAAAGDDAAQLRVLVAGEPAEAVTEAPTRRLGILHKRISGIVTATRSASAAAAAEPSFALLAPVVLSRRIAAAPPTATIEATRLIGASAPPPVARHKRRRSGSKV